MAENNRQMQELPTGWAWANIDDLISTNGLFCDGDWIETKDQDSNGNVRLIQLADIGDGVFKNRSDRHLTYEKSVELCCTYLSKGDLLIARLPDPLGRACLFPLEGEKQYVTAVDICIVRPNSENLNIKLLLYLINSPQIRREVDKFKSGSTRKRISRKNLAKIQLSIAPTLEQHCIVAKIEELFSELDNGIESLKKAREQLKTYRQAVLKYAFEGKLTKGSVKARNVKINDLFTLIDGDRGRNYPKKNDYLQKGFCLFLSTKNVRFGKFEFYETVFISEKKHNELRSGTLNRGDIVITTRGTIGNVAFYNERIPYDVVRINSGMLILRAKSDIVYEKYFLHYVGSPQFWNQIQKKRSGTAQPQLPAGVLKEFNIPFFARHIQHNIVQEIESRLSVCDKIEQTIEDSLKKAEALRQSILKKAFNGELTREWRERNPELITGENSAEKLLERIKEEKARLAEDTKKRRSGRVKKK